MDVATTDQSMLPDCEEGLTFFPRNGSDGNHSSAALSSHIINEDTSLLTSPNAVANAFIVDADAVSLPSTPPSESGGGAGDYVNTHSHARMASGARPASSSLRASSASASASLRARALSRPQGAIEGKKRTEEEDLEEGRGKERTRGRGSQEDETTSLSQADLQGLEKERHEEKKENEDDLDDETNKEEKRKKGKAPYQTGGLKLSTKGGVGKLQYCGRKGNKASMNVVDVDDPAQQAPRKVILWAEMSDQVGGKKKAGATAFKFYNGTCVRSVTIFADVWVSLDP